MSETGFNKTKVLVFESRLAEKASKTIERLGGRAVHAPVLKEIALTENPEVIRFGEKLLAGGVDILILMTGVGTRMLLDLLFAELGRSPVLQSLEKVVLVARGPKPEKVLRDMNLPVTIRIPEPNTSGEIVEALDLDSRGVQLEDRTVAIQEYGQPSVQLCGALKKRGARVMQVPVYRWALPDDTGPARAAIEQAVQGGVGAAVFTSAVQMRHALQLASEMGLENSFRKALADMVICSIGPTCSAAILNEGLRIDFEPSRSKLALFLSEAAGKYERLSCEKKSGSGFVLARRSHDPAVEKKQRQDSAFMRACRLEHTDSTPVWLMRQAGRYMKEYRVIRDRVSFLELCKSPELCAQVCIEAQEKIGADAAILFSDILLIVEALGMGLEYAHGEGPVITGAIRGIQDVDRLPEIDPDHLSYVYEAVKLTRECLTPKVPLIGFSGAPFTLAAYMLEGGTSRVFLKTRQFMFSDPGAWHALMEKLTRGLIQYLKRQVEAGADVLQVFDSWVGCLSPDDYRQFVMPHSKRLISELPEDVPVIHFGTGTTPFLEDIRSAGGDIIGLDYHTELDAGWNRVGPECGVQGNLDPVELFSSPERLRSRVQRILRQAAGRPGHIFNLGHGILPQTPVDHVISLIDMVHEFSSCPSVEPKIP